MESHQEYNSYRISWRETGEQFAALLRREEGEEPPAIVTASVGEGMAVLESRVFAAVDAGTIEAYRPNLTAPDQASPVQAFASFLKAMEQNTGQTLAKVSGPERLSAGWAFYYQSQAYVETGDFRQQLVGHGPVVVADDGRLIEGGSLDSDPELLLARS